ncbi:CL3L1 protein, partial [Rhagologus leucostigma]|nr:CL3L1 protein [Rhagologus leucostigma]
MLHSLQILWCHCLVMQFTTSPLPSTAHFTPVECCFEHAQKAIRYPLSFYETSKDCPKPAVVFLTASGDRICANPKSKWVKKAKQDLQKKK